MTQEDLHTEIEEVMLVPFDLLELEGASESTNRPEPKPRRPCLSSWERGCARRDRESSDREETMSGAERSASMG
jgi:hypothetical protein